MKNGSHRLFFILVFVSGGLAILYQAIWFRMLSLVLGSTATAMVLIISSFMAGLGFGSLLVGIMVDKRNPLRVYQFLELGIGLYALISYLIFSPLNIIYGALYDVLSGHGLILSISRFMLSFVFLCIPTMLMGGTLPAAVKYLTRKYDLKATEISTYYWVNTFGGALSALLIPLFLFPKYAIHHLLMGGACVNVLIFLFLFFLKAHDAPVDEEKGSAMRAGNGNLLPYVSIFLSGLASLALEALWNRHFVLIMGGATYTFCVILFIYLLGITMGSIIYQRLCRRYDSIKVYIFAIAASALYLSISLLGYDALGPLQLRILSSIGVSFASYQLTNILILLLIVFPVTVCFGVAFPAGLSGISRTMKSIGKEIGIVYMVNSIGTAIGPIFLSIILLPMVGFKASYSTLVIILIIASAGMAVFSISRRTLQVIGLFSIASVVLLVGAGAWNPMAFLMGTQKNPLTAVKNYQKSGSSAIFSDFKVLFESNDKDVHAAVVQYKDEDKSLVINGKADASDGADMVTQSIFGHLPFLVNPGPVEDVFIIGMGSGVTTHCVLTHDVKNVITAEISAAVVEAAQKYFGHVNSLSFSDPRSHIVVQDGRNYLTNEDTLYDIIISEPSNPWLAGVSNLFTKEFFVIVKKRLKTDGLFCQWINSYNLALPHVIGVLKTLRDVFPIVTVFYNIQTQDFILLASEREIAFDADGMEQFSDIAQEQLKGISILSGEELYMRFIWDSHAIEAMSSDYAANTDTLPWLEYLAPFDMMKSKEVGEIDRLLSLNGRSQLTLEMQKEETPDDVFYPALPLRIAKEIDKALPEEILVSETMIMTSNNNQMIRANFFKISKNGIDIYAELGHALRSKATLMEYISHYMNCDKMSGFHFQGSGFYGAVGIDRASRKYVAAATCPGQKRTYVVEMSQIENDQEAKKIIDEVMTVCKE